MNKWCSYRDERRRADSRKGRKEEHFLRKTRSFVWRGILAVGARRGALTSGISCGAGLPAVGDEVFKEEDGLGEAVDGVIDVGGWEFVELVFEVVEPGDFAGGVGEEDAAAFTPEAGLAGAGGFAGLARGEGFEHTGNFVGGALLKGLK